MPFMPWYRETDEGFNEKSGLIGIEFVADVEQ